MKNKFTGNVTLRQLIEKCEQITPHRTSNRSYVYLSTYSKKTRESLINYKKITCADAYSVAVGEEPAPDNQISVTHSDIGLIEVEWSFNEQQRKIYGVENKNHSLIFTRTDSGNLEPRDVDDLEFVLNLDELLVVRENGECVTLEVDQTAIYNSNEFPFFDQD
ncbi:hypothetical protein N9Y41_02540 [Planktomarina temperata]|nr:hypothetical protein [Planktomarina temperata]